jgi:excisionase family DNA binding protein
VNVIILSLYTGMNEDSSTTGPFFDTTRTVKELATYMGVTERFIYAEIARGKLYPSRVDINIVRLHPEDIKNWLRGVDVPKRIINPKAKSRKRGANAVTHDILSEISHNGFGNFLVRRYP